MEHFLYLYVVASVDEQASEYQGMLPDSDVLLTVMVKMDVAYLKHQTSLNKYLES
jgi:hypothetical protein